VGTDESQRKQLRATPERTNGAVQEDALELSRSHSLFHHRRTTPHPHHTALAPS